VLGGDEVAGVVGEGWEEEKNRLLTVMGSRKALNMVLLKVMAFPDLRMVLAELCMRC